MIGSGTPVAVRALVARKSDYIGSWAHSIRFEDSINLLRKTDFIGFSVIYGQVSVLFGF